MRTFTMQKTKWTQILTHVYLTRTSFLNHVKIGYVMYTPTHASMMQLKQFLLSVVLQHTQIRKQGRQLSLR